MLADRLSRYCQSLCYDDLPSLVVHEVKRRVLDSLGCALGAWNALPCRIARRVGQSVQSPDGATLWGTNHKTLPELARSRTAPSSAIWISTIHTSPRNPRILQTTLQQLLQSERPLVPPASA